VGESRKICGRHGRQEPEDLRIAEIEKLDVQLKDGKVEAYRVKMKVSFKSAGKA
jgi:flavin-binding protein dodecin